MHTVELTHSALQDLKSLRKVDQRRVLQGIEAQLIHEPSRETRNRKRLRPNEIAEWELRLDRFRVFYNVGDEELTVSVEAIGFKVGNILIIRDEERLI
jgi:mRNA-degrading endonuclease RelE of RelBE toxin-antitoxin system